MAVTAPETIELTEDQVVIGRLRRTGLAPGFKLRSPADAVRASCGLQAQDATCALLSLCARLASPETAAAALVPPTLTVMRFHSQRGTIHLQPLDMVAQFSAMNTVLVDPRAAHYDYDPETYELAIRELEQAGVTGATTDDLCLGKHGSHALFKLSREGLLTMLLRRQKTRTVYVARSALSSSATAAAAAAAAPIDGNAAGVEIMRTFIRAFGPVTEADIRRQFGARLMDIRPWLASLRSAGELVNVKCGNRKGLFALRTVPVVPVNEVAPTVVLPPFDSFTLALADKSWLFHNTPTSSLRVFGRNGAIAGLVLVRGKAVIMWRLRHGDGTLTITWEPLDDAPEVSITEAAEALQSAMPSMATALGLGRHILRRKVDEPAAKEDDASENEDVSDEEEPKKKKKKKVKKTAES